MSEFDDCFVFSCWGVFLLRRILVLRIERGMKKEGKKEEKRREARAKCRGCCDPN
jgi:hypothetical protein